MITHFQLVDAPLLPDRIAASMRSDKWGAEVFFHGVVRNKRGEKEVQHLEFEAYEPMVYSELEKIATTIKKQWPIQAIVMHHRLGTVRAGELAIVLAVYAVHRAEAFEASAYFMNQLKATVPIWKKEVYSDGAFWVSATP
jgi:molybdopterin synthase catalytic subunit